MRAAVVAIVMGLSLGGCAQEPQCVFECTGNRECVGQDLYQWQGHPWTGPCRPDPMVCRRVLVKHCLEGCLSSYDSCVEDIPPPPPPPPPPPVLAMIGTACSSDADCRPAGRINTPEGPRQLELHCGAMGRCEDAIYERCNGVDDDADGEVDEGCALGATMRPLAIAGRPVEITAHASEGVAITTGDDVIHFFDATLVEGATHSAPSSVSLTATRDGFAYADTYPIPGDTSTDVVQFSGDGATNTRVTITPGQQFSRAVEVRDGLAWLLTTDGLQAFDAVTGAQLGIPAIATDLTVRTPAFSIGDDIVLCAGTQTGWVTSAGALTIVDEPCAPRMARGPDVLWGFAGSVRRYPPRAFSVEVAELTASATSPAFGTPHGIAFTATNTRALIAVAYSEASPAFITLTEVSLDGAIRGYSTRIEPDDELIGSAQRGEVTLLFVYSPTMGARVVLFAPR